MRNLLLLLVLISVSGAGQTGQKEEMFMDSGAAFVVKCAEKKSIIPAMCQVFVAGVVQAIAVSDTHRACIPQGVTIEQSFRMTMKYLNEHPEQLHLLPARAVIAAHEEAFPCMIPFPEKK